MSTQGFTYIQGRHRRLRLFLDTCGCSGPVQPFIEMVRQRVPASAYGIRRIAATGDAAYQKMIEQGVGAALDNAVNELADFPDA